MAQDETSSPTQEEIIEDIVSKWKDAPESEKKWLLGHKINERKEPGSIDYPRWLLDGVGAKIGVRRDTVRQIAWVSDKIPKDLRGMPGMKWGHYRAAAGTDDPKRWLTDASTGSWSVAVFRNEVNANKTQGKPCSDCGKTAYGKEAYHVHPQGGKVIHFCSARCAANWFAARP
jgi:hypothetical protein